MTGGRWVLVEGSFGGLTWAWVPDPPDPEKIQRAIAAAEIARRAIVELERAARDEGRDEIDRVVRPLIDSVGEVP